ncbi:hypothetical protein WR30_26175 [Burkholderia contaminans FFH2055]|nr:hypothetical protein WR30_26175 [Burkholderia contaminans FFH2055]
MSCYSDCLCECMKTPLAFDYAVEAETRFPWRLHDVCHSNIGYYTDKMICDVHLLEDWVRKDAFGVYVLWHKDDYCETHNLFHMRALYVGKGRIGKRLLDHWKKKDFSDEMIVYWTFLEIPNRQAKYCEQLILDTYCVPLNKAESTGELLLCSHFTQIEVD